jgi:hypothetical protein
MSSKRRRRSRLPDRSEPRRLGSDILTSHVGIYDVRNLFGRASCLVMRMTRICVLIMRKDSCCVSTTSTLTVDPRRSPHATILPVRAPAMGADGARGVHRARMATLRTLLASALLLSSGVLMGEPANRSTSISHRTWPMV